MFLIFFYRSKPLPASQCPPNKHIKQQQTATCLSEYFSLDVERRERVTVSESGGKLRSDDGDTTDREEMWQESEGVGEE